MNQSYLESVSSEAKSLLGGVEAAYDEGMRLHGLGMDSLADESMAGCSPSIPRPNWSVIDESAGMFEAAFDVVVDADLPMSQLDDLVLVGAR